MANRDIRMTHVLGIRYKENNIQDEHSHQTTAEIKHAIKQCDNLIIINFVIIIIIKITYTKGIKSVYRIFNHSSNQLIQERS